VAVWLGKNLEVGGQWDGRLTLTFSLTEQPDDHWLEIFNIELSSRQHGLQGKSSSGPSSREPIVVFRDVGLETLRETLDVIGAALEATRSRYASDVQFTEMISRQALAIVKEWREELGRPS
jgi:hypothetical protein